MSLCQEVTVLECTLEYRNNTLNLGIQTSMSTSGHPKIIQVLNINLQILAFIPLVLSHHQSDSSGPLPLAVQHVHVVALSPPRAPHVVGFVTKCLKTYAGRRRKSHKKRGKTNEEEDLLPPRGMKRFRCDWNQPSVIFLP